jgi:hypothetical protein
MRLQASIRLYDAARLEGNEHAKHYLLLDFVDDLRQCRKINIKEWELGRALAEEWQGTTDDLLNAIKELA